MNLAAILLKQIDEPGLASDERAARRCALAHDLEKAGSYETARKALGELWQGIGLRPEVGDFDRRTQAEILLRVGALSGWLGSAQQITGSQESAKDLISESMAVFSELGETVKASEAEIELAWCYWREGAYDEARVTLQHASANLPDSERELKGLALVRRAEVERSAARHRDALPFLLDAAPLVDSCDSQALKGKFHSTLA
ncbi:MAG TPA: hypothetical protein VJT82_09885, partial [Pyrinomonadaceae bacterium]|nr:hypothetical protein [Pyrinomonadaceae bacterium]